MVYLTIILKNYYKLKTIFVNTAHNVCTFCTILIFTVLLFKCHMTNNLITMPSCLVIHWTGLITTENFSCYFKVCFYTS